MHLRVARVGIGIYFTQRLTCFYGITLFHIYALYIAIESVIVSMTDNDTGVISRNCGYIGYFTIKYGFGIGSRLRSDVYTSARGGYIPFAVLVCTKTCGNGCVSWYRVRESTFICRKVVRQCYIFGSRSGNRSTCRCSAFTRSSPSLTLIIRCRIIIFRRFCTRFFFSYSFCFTFLTGYLFGDELRYLSVEGFGLISLLSQYFLEVFLFALCFANLLLIICFFFL